MSNTRPGIGDYTFIIMARALASLVAALGTTLAVVLAFAGAYAQAAIGLILFLALAFCTSRLIKGLDTGRVLLPSGYIHHSRQPAAFLFVFSLYCALIVALMAGSWWYLTAAAAGPALSSS